MFKESHTFFLKQKKNDILTVSDNICYKMKKARFDLEDIQPDIKGVKLDSHGM